MNFHLPMWIRMHQSNGSYWIVKIYTQYCTKWIFVSSQMMTNICKVVIAIQSIQKSLFIFHILVKVIVACIKSSELCWRKKFRIFCFNFVFCIFNCVSLLKFWKFEQVVRKSSIKNFVLSSFLRIEYETICNVLCI